MEEVIELERNVPIKEAFDTTIKGIGEVKFANTKLSDAHIQKLLKNISKTSGIPVSELEDRINAKMAEFKSIASKSPILYSTIELNIIESEVFNIIKDSGHSEPDSEKFSTVIFGKLMRMIKAEHDQFFPLRDVIDSKNLKNPNIIFVPSNKSEYQKYNKIDTAAATPHADFIFNLNFMQHLMDFAHVKGVKPKLKKYKSNGGEIPDEYCFIEFLIIHELMHFTYGDFHYGKIFKVSPTIINWVGDFRSNYILVKSGYEQLPMGLFNDMINMDRQKSYREMVEIVEAEFKKLSKEEQDKVKDEIEGDDHSPGNESADGTDGDGGDDDWTPTVGSPVIHPDGSYGKITKIHPNGDIETTPISKEEAEELV